MELWNWLVAFGATFWGIVLYWIPATICLIGFTLRSIGEIRKDFTARRRFINDEVDYYIPQVLVGTVVGRTVVAFIPIANIFSAAFDFVPTLFEDVIKKFKELLDFPLIPKPKKAVKNEKD